MDLITAKGLYDMLKKLSNQAFDIVFGNENIAKDSNVNKQTLGTNLDQYIQCLLVKCLLDRNALDDNYFDIVKHLTNFDCFMNIPSISSGSITNEDLLEYVNKAIDRVPLFIDVVIHVDKTCLENDPEFDTRFSKDVFSCVVQIVKHIVPYNEVSDIAECLFEALKPVLNKYQEAKLKYFD
jgi:hypothetical protein